MIKADHKRTKMIFKKLKKGAQAMVKFEYKDYSTELPNWSRHHKTIGARVKRVYEDGEVTLPKEKKVQQLVKEYESALIPHAVTLINWDTSKERSATDYYLPCKNTDYKEADVLDYGVGAVNTKETLHIRLKFVMDYATIYLDHELKTEGSYALSFFGLLSMDIDDLIDEIVENSKGLAEDGIEASKEEGSDYHVVAVTNYGEATDFHLEKRDLQQALVGIEVYQFDLEIVDDKKELKNA